MKNVLCVVLAVAMMLSLCACSAPTENTYEGTAEELDSLLLSISQIPVGTMGVSMTITARAVEFLDWCEVASMSGEELAAVVKAYHDKLDADAQSLFLEQVAVTVNGVALLANNESRENVLDSAGFSKKLTWEESVFSLAACADDQL